jgi:hypothetical protein
MEKTTKVSESSTLYRKIDELGLPALDRAEAIAALETADKLADGIYWVFEKLDRVTTLVLHNPNLKHQ